MESFIDDVLYKAGICDHPSDGISLLRVVERSPVIVRIAGQIYEISQEGHSFWLDLERDEKRPERINWTLYFDIVPDTLSDRRVRTMIEAIDLPEQIDWRLVLMGAAALQDATLIVESVTTVSMENPPV